MNDFNIKIMTGEEFTEFLHYLTTKINAEKTSKNEYDDVSMSLDYNKEKDMFVISTFNNEVKLSAYMKAEQLRQMGRDIIYTADTYLNDKQQFNSHKPKFRDFSRDE